MHATPFLLASLVLTAHAATPSPDPLHSPDCLQAMVRLQSGEAASPGHAPASAGHPPSAAVLVLRRQAAHACLGTRLDAALPTRGAVPAVQLAAPVGVAPITVLRQRVPTTVSTPLVVPGPVTTAGCNAAGCFASDGTWMQRVDPQLLGPRGLCSLQVGLISCP